MKNLKQSIRWQFDRSLHKGLFAVVLIAVIVVGIIYASPNQAAQTNAIAAQFKPNHVALRVPNLEPAIAWYQDIFDAKIARRSKIPKIDPQIEIAMLEISNGFHIELVGNGKPQRVIPAKPDIAQDYSFEGYRHIGFMVDDWEGVLAYLRKKKVDVFYETTRPDYGVRIALFRDLNGYPIELYGPLSNS